MRHRNLSAWLVFGVLIALASAVPAGSLELESAKAKGLIGERADGFVGAVPANPSPEIDRLVEDVNTKRRARYQEIATRNGQPLDVVAALAGEKLIQRTPAGQWVTDAEGNWYQKK